jgi:hypothetical protein
MSYTKVKNEIIIQKADEYIETVENIRKLKCENIINDALDILNKPRPKLLRWIPKKTYTFEELKDYLDENKGFYLDNTLLSAVCYQYLMYTEEFENSYVQAKKIRKMAKNSDDEFSYLTEGVMRFLF